MHSLLVRLLRRTPPPAPPTPATPEQLAWQHQQLTNYHNEHKLKDNK